MNSGTLKKSLFFFISLEINNVSSIIIIKIDKNKNEQTIELDNQKISIEDLYWNNKTHKTPHRKLNTEKINSFKIRIFCMNNNRCYTSDEVKIQKNNFILDSPIKLFLLKRPENQINFSNQVILYHNLH